MLRPDRVRVLLCLVLALFIGSGCREHEPTPADLNARHRLEAARALRHLRRYERELRRASDPQSARPFVRALGPDPYRLCRVGSRFVGVLRGSSALVLLDAELNELSRVRAPSTPVDCAVSDAGEVLVVGALERTISVYRVAGQRLHEIAQIALPDAVRPRALAVSGRSAWLADEGSGLLTTFELGASGAPAPRSSTPVCRGPIAISQLGQQLVVNCLLEHALVLRALGSNGQVGPETARISHDGPFWGFSALALGSELWVAASGVEDHPLERFGGAFGYVDSFVYLYRVAAGRAERVQAINGSALSLLVPKALLLEAKGDRLLLAVASSGSDALAEFEFELARPTEPPRIERRTFVPGVSALLRSGQALVASSPLLDTWAELGTGQALVVRTPASAEPLPPPSARLGEALVFTELIAPFATSQGKNSRFTCETCHFEGGIDGRIHHTGRGEVRVTTRPLFGLLENAPHFSRALDPDLASVSHNEFRVAGLGNAYDPWFSLPSQRFAWLRQLGVEGELDPESLRRALIEFLARFEPEQNPKVLGRSAFRPLEREGAEAFRDRCASCHAARLESDRTESEQPFAAWQARIFSEAGPVQWARGEYEKTGIEPYVHEQGTRVPSLRRIVRKYPYFTDGSARSLSDVLGAARVLNARFFHARAPDGAAPLAPAEQRALQAFLELL